MSWAISSDSLNDRVVVESVGAGRPWSCFLRSSAGRSPSGGEEDAGVARGSTGNILSGVIVTGRIFRKWDDIVDGILLRKVKKNTQYTDVTDPYYIGSHTDTTEKESYDR